MKIERSNLEYHLYFWVKFIVRVVLGLKVLLPASIGIWCMTNPFCSNLEITLKLFIPALMSLNAIDYIILFYLGFIYQPDSRWKI